MTRIETRAQIEAIYQYFLHIMETDVRYYQDQVQPLTFPIIPKTILAHLCQEVGTIFLAEPNILSLDKNIIIVGDIHGHILDLLRIFYTFGTPENRRYLLLGDLVDRGEFSLETVVFVFALKFLYPKNIYIIRGNHEFQNLFHRCGFGDEIEAFYNDMQVENFFARTFANMPFAARVDESIFCVHAGIGPSLTSIDMIRNIQRPLYEYEKEPVLSLMWSDPSEFIENFAPSTRGNGYLFGAAALSEFLNNNVISLLVRGHECMKTGVEKHLNKRMMTVFSASNYCGVSGNKSGVLIIGQSGAREIETFTPLKHLKRDKVRFAKCVNERPLTFDGTASVFQGIQLPVLAAADELIQKNKRRSSSTNLMNQNQQTEEPRKKKVINAASTTSIDKQPSMLGAGTMVVHITARSGLKTKAKIMPRRSLPIRK